jgi:hypothetical protein
MRMTRAELIDAGLVKIDPTKRGNDVGHVSVASTQMEMHQSYKSLLNLRRPPKWLAFKPVSEMTEREKAQELDRQIRRLAWHGKPRYRHASALDPWYRLVFVERETNQAEG